MQNVRPGATLGLLACALIGPNLLAQDAQKVIDEFNTASQTWYDKYKAAATKEERTKILATRPSPKQSFDKLFEAIDRAPASENAFVAANWMVTRGQARGADQNRAMATLLKHHAGSEKLASVCGSIGRTPTLEAERFLATLFRQSSHDSVRGQACLNLAQLYKSQAGLARMLKTAKKDRIQSLTSYYGRQTIDVMKNADVDKLEKRAKKHYRKVMDTPEFAGIGTGRSSLAAMAKGNLFELENLAIGRVAPEIVGEDIDGNPMQLSSYRGKVVVLDFWGDW